MNDSVSWARKQALKTVMNCLNAAAAASNFMNPPDGAMAKTAGWLAIAERALGIYQALPKAGVDPAELLRMLSGREEDAQEKADAHETLDNDDDSLDDDGQSRRRRR